jgi:hypothetical protein
VHRPESMPEELWAAIRAESPRTAAALLTNWQRIGREGREQYVTYVRRGWTRRGRRRRAQLAAAQLLTPAHDPGVPLPGPVMPY